MRYSVLAQGCAPTGGRGRGSGPALDLRQRQRQVVDACARRLLISYGLRSLAPGEPGYRPRYAGGPRERDGAYHQGTAWAWLLGPFALAYDRVHGDRAGSGGKVSESLL